jgi:hypothetical protein
VLAVIASLPPVVDALSGGAQHGVDHLAPSDETSRLHAVTTCVDVVDWSPGRAARSHMTALVRRHRPLFLAQVDAPVSPRLLPVHSDRRAGRPRPDGPCCGPARKPRPARRTSATTDWRGRDARPERPGRLTRHSQAVGDGVVHPDHLVASIASTEVFGAMPTSPATTSRPVACNSGSSGVTDARTVSEIALWDRTGWRLSLAASLLTTRKTGRPPDDGGAALRPLHNAGDADHERLGQRTAGLTPQPPPQPPAPAGPRIVAPSLLASNQSQQVECRLAPFGNPRFNQARSRSSSGSLRGHSLQ